MAVSNCTSVTASDGFFRFGENHKYCENLCGRAGSGLNMDQPPAGARVRTMDHAASCWCQGQDYGPCSLLLVPGSGLWTMQPPAGARVRTMDHAASCWCQGQDYGPCSLLLV
ncbi:hypothetical protein WMY93_016294 [Mugilogobius chulae]|uniref:Uncharacterized protein n=1 Tax=Mugilogobius chulae TaxID=88201 RepID=A0AAW0NTQ3_9GOBI